MEFKDPVSLQPIPESAKLVFTGKLFEVFQWQQKMYDGSYATFEKIKRAASVGVLPITVDNKIILTFQEQPGMTPFISLVGGVVDPGEKPEEAALRELLEESGREAEKLDFWFSLQPVTKLEWPIYTYIAKGCKKVSDQNLDVGEKIRLKEYTWEEFLEVILEENFRDKEVSFRLLKAMQVPGELEKIKEMIFS